MIIAFDIVIVLLVYLFYTQVRVVENESQRRMAGINYTLTVNQISDGSIPVTFSLTSRRRTPYTTSFPNGVTLMLSDGQQTVYWRGKLGISQSLKMPAGGERGWTRKIPRPDDSSPPYYVGFYIDDDRQAQVKVPE
jgi:hypothetical protein